MINKAHIKITGALRRFWKDKNGATSIEYGLIAALICVAIIGGTIAMDILFNNLNVKP